MNEYKKLKKISNRLKSDYEIPESMRLKYLMLDIELGIINENIINLNKSIKMYRNVKSELYHSIYKELVELKKNLPLKDL